MGQPLRIGIIGCGNISGAYLKTLPGLSAVRLVAIAGIDLERAREAADGYPGVRILSVTELLADPEVDTLLNLTIPAAHAEVALAAIAAGKHVYGEKPLAASARTAKVILTAAAQAGVTVGCAPDTVLGTGIQTARRAIDDGRIGRPISATATMVTPGHERWHPNPDLYYAPGGGPLLDVGSYYVTALLTLLGPVTSVIKAASINTGRRIGIQDLALTAPEELPRANGQLAFHALEIMESLLASAHSGQSVTITSSCGRPAPVPLTEPIPTASSA